MKIHHVNNGDKFIYKGDVYTKIPTYRGYNAVGIQYARFEEEELEQYDINNNGSKVLDTDSDEV